MSGLPESLLPACLHRASPVSERGLVQINAQQCDSQQKWLKVSLELWALLASDCSQVEGSRAA